MPRWQGHPLWRRLNSRALSLLLWLHVSAVADTVHLNKHTHTCAHTHTQAYVTDPHTLMSTSALVLLVIYSDYLIVMIQHCCLRLRVCRVILLSVLLLSCLHLSAAHYSSSKVFCHTISLRVDLSSKHKGELATAVTAGSKLTRKTTDPSGWFASFSSSFSS